MLKVRVAVIFTRTNSCVKCQSSCDLVQGLTAVLKVRVAVIFARTNTCVKGQSSCDLCKD